MSSWKIEARHFFKSWEYLAFFGLFILLLLFPSFSQLTGKKDPHFGREQASWISKREATGDILKRWREEGSLAQHQNPSEEDLTQEVKLMGEIVNNLLVVNDPAIVTEKKLAFEEFYLQEMEKGRQDAKNSLVEQQEIVAYYRYLLAHNLPEVFTHENGKPAIVQLKQVFLTGLPSLWLLTFLSVWVAYFILKEKRQPTVDFLNLMPRSKGFLYFQKQFIFILVSFFSLILASVLNFALLALRNGVGGFNYPIFYSHDGKTVQYLASGTYLIYFILFMGAILLLFTGISACLQLFTRNILVNLLVLMSLAFSPDFGWRGKFFPLSYLQINEVLVPTNGNGGLLSPLAGLILLAGWGIFLILVSCSIANFRKRI